MTDKLKHIIEEGSKNLPQEVVGVINSFEWEKISNEIGKKYLLDDNEIDTLKTEIVLAMIGTKSQDVLVFDIEDNVGTTKNDAMQMTEEINEKIFKPMMEKLESSIKNGLRTRNQKWNQTINFIISGGDYLVFLEKEDKPTIITNPSSINTKSNSNI